MKTALITGATSGIGWETALLFAQKGYRIVAMGRNLNKLEKLKNKLPKGDHLFVRCELNDLQGVKATLDDIIHQTHGIDVLVNNAGQGIFKPLLETSPEEESQTINVNLLAPMQITRQVLRVMKEQKSGAIVNISSVAGKRTFKNLSAYCASKFGLIGFSNSLRRELKFNKIPVSVSVICPPATRTNFFKNANYLNFEEDHPGLKMADPKQVAQEIYSAVQHKKREVIVTPRAKILDKLAALSPAFVEWLEDKASQ